MTALRLVVASLVLAALAACGGGSEPKPPAPTPTVPPAAPAATVPKVRVPVAVAPVPSAPSPGQGAEIAPEPAAASSRPLSSADAAAREPIYGTWATDLANCRTGAITITARRFEGAQSGCDIESMVDDGRGTFLTTLSCRNGGQTGRERVAMEPLFAPTGEGIGLTYLDRGNQEVTVLRCEVPRG